MKKAIAFILLISILAGCSNNMQNQSDQNISVSTSTEAIKEQTTSAVPDDLGLKSDGTVIAAGRNTYGQMNVEEWNGIVAIAAGYYFSIGLKSDGTMVIAGDCSSSGVKTPDVTNMKNLYVPQIALKN